MLNELIQAAKALEAAGIAGKTLHKELKTLPKSASYKVLLATDGSVADVQPWAEDVAGLRKWQPGGNGFSFPVFNIAPLFALNLDETTQNALKKVEAEIWPTTFQHIEGECNDTARTWLVLDKQGNIALNERYRKSMVDVPNQFLTTSNACEMSHPVLSALVDRLKSQLPERFFLSLAAWLADKLRHNYDARLFTLYCSTSPAEAKKNINILLDIPDWDDIGEYPVTSGETANYINNLLAARDGNDDETKSPQSNSLDAYGQPATRAGEKFDDINVGGLGKIILRAMTKDAPCQYRYGKADADSFVMGQSSRRQAKIALESLANSEAKGKTWQFRGGNLVLLYPESSLPSFNELGVADICSLPDDDDEQAGVQATFVARAERIAQAFDGRPRESETPIHLIVLRKPDGFRTKNVSHRFFTMKHLVESARHWEIGAKECPPVSFARWGKEKGKREDIVPDVPFPSEVVNWLNTYWVHNGMDQGKVSTFRLEDALTLLLANDGSEKPLIAHALRHAITNWSGFLIAHGADQRLAVILKFPDKRSAPLRCLPAILSLLLYKLGYTKERIMSSPAFLVGRLLALSDSLHTQYCLAVRNGSIPPQLLGNALMQAALETPQAALALYAQRILPYQAWAASCKVENPKSAESLAKWLLGQLGDTCSQVALSEIPERASDADKAQMILGYLAKTKLDE